MLPKPLNPNLLNGNNYSPERGAICPNCLTSTIPGETQFYINPFLQKFVGWSKPPWPKRVDIAVVFECPNCFEKYWFHWTKSAAQTLFEHQKEKDNAS